MLGRSFPRDRNKIQVPVRLGKATVTLDAAGVSVPTHRHTVLGFPSSGYVKPGSSCFGQISLPHLIFLRALFLDPAPTNQKFLQAQIENFFVASRE